VNSGLRERILVGGGLALFAAAFAWFNGHVRVDVNLGLVKIDTVPLPIVVFVAFLLGMLTLFLASLKADLRTQRMLRRYREALGREGAPSPRASRPERAADTGVDPATKET